MSRASLLILFALILLLSQLPVRFGVKAQNLVPTFTISTDKTNYFVGEPVELNFTLVNNNNQPLRGYFDFGLEYKNPELWYQRSDQDAPIRFISRLVDSVAAHDYISVPRIVEPGEKQSQTLRLLYVVRPSGLVLSTPGEYEFQAKLYYNTYPPVGTTILEAKTRIAVHELPSGEESAFSRWNDPDLLDFLQGNAGLVEDSKFQAGKRKLMDFVRDNVGSVYAKTAKSGLLEHLRKIKLVLTDEERQLYNQLLQEKLQQ
jgi:hypothetical protein